jgi:HEPN domain-containing protein
MEQIMPETMNWEDWVRFAEDDWLTAVEIVEQRPQLAIHLLHQSIEKYFKAVLVKRDIVPERSHDLIKLLQLVDESIEFNDLPWVAARELNAALPGARYPTRFVPDAATAHRLLEHALQLRSIARAKLE